ncbi:unnamed protein product, partial [Vitrella brassicaformis CCMP3155]
YDMKVRELGATQDEMRASAQREQELQTNIRDKTRELGECQQRLRHVQGALEQSEKDRLEIRQKHVETRLVQYKKHEINSMTEISTLKKQLVVSEQELENLLIQIKSFLLELERRAYVLEADNQAKAREHEHLMKQLALAEAWKDQIPLEKRQSILQARHMSSFQRQTRDRLTTHDSRQCPMDHLPTPPVPPDTRSLGAGTSTYKQGYTHKEVPRTQAVVQPPRPYAPLKFEGTSTHKYDMKVRELGATQNEMRASAQREQELQTNIRDKTRELGECQQRLRHVQGALEQSEKDRLEIRQKHVEVGEKFERYIQRVERENKAAKTQLVQYKKHEINSMTEISTLKKQLVVSEQERENLLIQIKSFLLELERRAYVLEADNQAKAREHEHLMKQLALAEARKDQIPLEKHQSILQQDI